MNNNLPEIAAAAQQLLLSFLAAAPEEKMRIYLSLRPEKEDYLSVFQPPAAKQLYTAYEEGLWMNANPEAMQASPEQTAVLITTSSTQLLRESEAARYDFPGGYATIMNYFSDRDLPALLFKFVEKGSDSGMSHNGLFCVNPEAADKNYRFVWMPKAWRVLG